MYPPLSVCARAKQSLGLTERVPGQGERLGPPFGELSCIGLENHDTINARC